MRFHTARINTIRTGLSVSALAVAVAVGGCADKTLPPIGANDHFRPDDEPRAVDDVFARQQAIAAREDGTFYAQHFTAGQLNSLGYQKLSAMAYGPAAGKLAIYLDVPKGDAYDADQASLTKALARGGLAEDQYAIHAGANPDVSAPAAQSLAALAKQTGGESDKSSSPDAGTINPTGGK